MYHWLTTFIATVMMCWTLTASAQEIPMYKLDRSRYQQDTLTNCLIHFEHDRGRIDPNYRNNQASIAKIKKAVAEFPADSLTSICLIVVEGSSSPVGREGYNKTLAYNRALNVANFLRTVPGLETTDLEINAKGEDWETFIAKVRESYFRPNRNQLLRILDSKLPNLQKKHRIMAMDAYQATWEYLVEHYMKDTRYSVVLVVARKKLNPDIPILPAIEAELEFPSEKDSSSASGLMPYTKPLTSFELQRVPKAAFRTNLLVPAMNVGLEIPMGNKVSMAVDYYYPWIWPSQKNKNCFELLGLNVEARYWFGRGRQPKDRLKGHSLGIYAAGGYYDFEKDYHGMQGEFVSAGLDYAYSVAVGRKKNVNLEFSLAFGCIRSWGRTYNVYGDYGELYPNDGLVIWNYAGPTKAAVSLVVPICKKEGRR